MLCTYFWVVGNHMAHPLARWGVYFGAVRWLDGMLFQSMLPVKRSRSRRPIYELPLARNTRE